MRDLHEIRKEVEKQEGTRFPSPVFARSVLDPVYTCQRDWYFDTFMDLSCAHALMLNRQGLLSDQEAAGILKGLDGLRQKDYSAVPYNPAYEDLFFMIEKDLGDLIGRDLAGRLHTARSRNDLGLAEYRIGTRSRLLEVLGALSDLLGTLLAFAKEHKAALMPAYTHTQPAQPTTLGHYMLSAYDALLRDWERIKAAYHQANRSPLGAAAITTTGFPIDRSYPAQVMGFEGLVENSYDSIAGADYLSGAAGALASLATTLSRFLKDTLDFCTVEFGFFRLADPYVQTSSIMPQKRNPSSLEHARPIASRALGGCLTIFSMLHNTPLTDMVDSEEDLQPGLYATCKDLVKVCELLRVNYATLTVNTEHMGRRAGAAFITATELADTLVREHGLSFRESHGLTAKLVHHLHALGGEEEISQQALSSMAQETLGREIGLSQAQLAKALDPAHFVRIRGITGGPAPEEMDRMITSRAQQPPSVQPLLAKLDQAQQQLRADSQALMESVKV